MSSNYTIFVSVIASVIVFIISELLKQICVQPLQEYRRLKQKIAYALVYYADAYSNPIDMASSTEERIARFSDSSNNLRKLAAEIDGFIETLSFVKIGIPSKSKLYGVSRDIICLSNSLFLPYNTGGEMFRATVVENHQKAENVKNALKLYSTKVKDEV